MSSPARSTYSPESCPCRRSSASSRSRSWSGSPPTSVAILRAWANRAGRRRAGRTVRPALPEPLPRVEDLPVVEHGLRPRRGAAGLRGVLPARGPARRDPAGARVDGDLRAAGRRPARGHPVAASVVVGAASGRTTGVAPGGASSARSCVVGLSERPCRGSRSKRRSSCSSPSVLRRGSQPAADRRPRARFVGPGRRLRVPRVDEARPAPAGAARSAACARGLASGRVGAARRGRRVRGDDDRGAAAARRGGGCGGHAGARACGRARRGVRPGARGPAGARAGRCRRAGRGRGTGARAPAGAGSGARASADRGGREAPPALVPARPCRARPRGRGAPAIRPRPGRGPAGRTGRCTLGGRRARARRLRSGRRAAHGVR